MNIKELNSLIREYVKVKPDNEFTDAKIIAESLGIVIKNNSECLSDLGENDYPLNESAAVYVLHKREHTIYYNENKELHNFSMAAMIVAQLAWYHLGEIPPNELCRIGAVILLIPEDLLLNDKMYSISDLSVKFGVPELYIKQYKDFLTTGNDRNFTCCTSTAKGNIKQQDVIFTPDDIHALFKFGEQIEEIHDNISKNSSVLAILAEGIASASREGISFTTETVLDAIEIIRDYIYKAEEISSHLNEEYHKLYSEKRNICFGEERVVA